ncbi:coiled-coil domain-containing protein 42 homolog isoform X2 [Colossoma macropomum]|uniref:coiled-coil domain-containing protein 42 homolog isoform X2 n=1 Tax=Colossoma macropomum TaxID=42526 RepID=UPI0018641470|nr:coiled-coil domain-containing protein 42 homolog isoform X2 [Colossoma macropomum]
MAVSLEDYFRTVFEEQLSTLPAPEEDLRTGATRLLDKRREIKHMDAALRTQQEEFEVKKESLRRRRDELKMKEEKLKDSLLKFDKYLKENDAKKTRGLKKAEAERAVVREREREAQQLQRNIAALLAKKEQLQARVNRNRIYWSFLDGVLKTSRKFEDVGQLIGRFDTLVCTREQLLKRQSEVESEREREGVELRRYVSERGSALLHYNNRLSQLQTDLDTILSQALRWESTWNHIQATAAKETLLLGQIKVVTLNLYHLTGVVAGGAEGVGVDDTLEQLDKVRDFIIFYLLFSVVPQVVKLFGKCGLQTFSPDCVSVCE